MEDAHTYVFDFAGVHGQGFFAVFDGHAGKEAADWCAKNFHEVYPRYSLPVPVDVAESVFSISCMPSLPTLTRLYPTS
jgi:hypothetical protein